VLAIHLLSPIVSGKTIPPRIALSAGAAAIDAAETAEAAVWAPHELSRAESLLTRARAESRRQEVTWVLWRDFTAVRSLLEETQERAHDAAEAARSNRQRAEEISEDALERAQAGVAVCTGFAALMPLSKSEQGTLGRARRRLVEADLANRTRDFREGIRLAEDSFDLSRVLGARAVERARRYLEPSTIRAWRKMIDETVTWSRRSGQSAIVIVKSARRLLLYDDGKLRFSVRADLGGDPIGDKRRAGDSATPEGRYRIVQKKDVGRSRYHRALLIDYPNEEDRRAANHQERRAGLGGLIEIHGEGGRGVDWTRGCIAVSNPDIDRLYAATSVGTPVTIVGSDGSAGRIGQLVADYEALFGSGSEPLAERAVSQR
jgi:hypothetical protein